MAVFSIPDRILAGGGDPDAPALVPDDDLFEQAGGEFLPAPELERIAERLMQRHDDTFSFAGQIEIAYLWKRMGGKDGGKARLGRCTKLSGLAKHGLGGDFAIWLAADHARDFGLTTWQVEAALFHELSHVSVEEDKPTVAPHDFAGFVAELDHYGAWYADLEAMCRSARQMALPGIDA